MQNSEEKGGAASCDPYRCRMNPLIQTSHRVARPSRRDRMRVAQRFNAGRAFLQPISPIRSLSKEHS